jgi:hypothetical protein
VVEKRHGALDHLGKLASPKTMALNRFQRLGVEVVEDAMRTKEKRQYGMAG